jgi:hypothetical protein
MNNQEAWDIKNMFLCFLIRRYVVHAEVEKERLIASIMYARLIRYATKFSLSSQSTKHFASLQKCPFMRQLTGSLCTLAFSAFGVVQGRHSRLVKFGRNLQVRSLFVACYQLTLILSCFREYVIREMVHNIVAPMISRPELTLARYDVHHALPNTANTLIGKTFI